MKKYLQIMSFVLVIMMSVILFAACGTKQGAIQEQTTKEGINTKATEAKKLVIGASVLTLEHPFYITYKKGLEDMAAKYGAELVVLDAQMDVGKQLNQINDLIAQKVDAIILTPVEPKAAVDMVKQCNEAGIPVIGQSSDIDADVAAKVLRDDLALGRIAGENAAKWINNNLNGEGRIAVFNYPTFSNTKAWEDGFVEKIKELSPKSKIISTIPSASKEEGLAAMEDVMQAHPDVNFTFSINDPVGLGTVQAIEASGKKSIYASFMSGGDQEAFDRLKKGTATGLIAGILQIYPYEDGTESLMAAIKAVNKESMPNVINTDGYWWDETNVNKYLETYPAYPKK